MIILTTAYIACMIFMTWAVWEEVEDNEMGIPEAMAYIIFSPIWLIAGAISFVHNLIFSGVSRH